MNDVSWLRLLSIVGCSLLVTGLTFRLVDHFGEFLKRYLSDTNQSGMIVAIPLARRVLKTLMVVLTILISLQNLGIHVTALLAGLGVGGIAVALGAQKAIGDLIGGIILVLDRPVRIGDDCKFGSQQGMVEEIGIRSIRIRTPERTLITVSNADFSQMQIENISARDRILFKTVLGIRRDTSPDQIRFLLIELRKLLYAHPKIDREPARVRLINLGNTSFDLEVLAYVLTQDRGEFLAVQEDLLLRFMDKIQEAGTQLAVPVEENLPPILLSQERVTFIKEQVAFLRENRELPLPEFSSGQIETLDDTLDYPPKGSVIQGEE